MSLRRIAAAALVAAGAGWTAAPPARGQGISEQEHERFSPPMPRGVEAERGRDGSTIVRWDAPPDPPSGRVAYSRALSRYRVYRGPPGAERLIGETRERRFVDRHATRAAGTGYVVTTVHGETLESGRTDPVRPPD